MTSDMPAMTKAAASRFFENLKRLEDTDSVLVGRLPISVGGEIIK